MIQRLSKGRNVDVLTMLPYRAGVIMLLAFYLAVFVMSPAGVPHVHEEVGIHHTDSCEKDPCHIAIYHPGNRGGCNHKFHFSEASKECAFCNVALPRQITTIEIDNPEWRIASSFSYIDIQHDLNEESFIELANRGPPCLV